MRNLEWYLDPIKRPKAPALFVVQGFAIGLNLLLGCINLYNAVHTHTTGFGSWVGWFNIAGALSIALSSSLCVGEARGIEKFRVNAAELYRYLVELHTAEQAE